MNSKPLAPVPPTRLLDLFVRWFLLGIQSFGGGSATFFLVQRACLTQGWMSEEEFLQSWALSQISPGINLIKLAVLIGYKLRKWPGIITAVGGFLLPSAVVTVLMTAGYTAISRQPKVAAAMRGIAPAVIGLAVAMVVQMGWPILRRGRQEGIWRTAIYIAIMAASAVLLATGMTSPILVLLLSGSSTMLLLMVVPARHSVSIEQGLEE